MHDCFMNRCRFEETCCFKITCVSSASVSDSKLQSSKVPVRLSVTSLSGVGHLMAVLVFCAAGGALNFMSSPRRRLATGKLCVDIRGGGPRFGQGFGFGGAAMGCTRQGI